MRFADRREAGRLLGRALDRLEPERPIVFGLPRGGVVVAYEVAGALGAQVDVVPVRKLGAPGRQELAIGAIAPDGVVVLNRAVLAQMRLDERDVADAIERERFELERRAHLFGGVRADVGGRTAIVVDDGLATGATARAAVRWLRARGAARIVVAVPVGAPETVTSLRDEADEVVCLEQPPRLLAIGAWYDDFEQVDDDEVLALLDAARAPATVRRTVEVVDGDVRLGGELSMPQGATGIVTFAHGSGSSRTSTRNQAVARALNDAGLATLLFDLLTPDEAAERSNVFDVALLARRVAAGIAFVRAQPETRDLPIGLFGASTGAAAALTAGARDAAIAAVVSRGGRPDMAGPALGRVRAPTLLIVGERDEVVLELNRRAQRDLQGPNALEIVPGATHLFEEPGALERVAGLARDWFTRCFARAAAGTGAAQMGRS